MEKIRAAITGVHGYLPDYVLTNKELETIVDTTDEWISTRTGIKERRILKEGGLSVMAVKAVEGLLEKTNTRPEDVELVICATITGDFFFPACANIVCDKVGMTNAFSYDVSAACSGFLYALDTASRYIETGKHKKVIVIGGDKMSSIIDYEDRNTCVIFGDGCGAVLLEPSEDGNGIIDSQMYSDGSGAKHLHMKSGGSLSPHTPETLARREQYVYQEGKHVFKRAVVAMADVSVEVMKRNNLSADDLAWLVPHQANLRIIDVTRQATGLPEEKVMINIQKFGNTTAGTLPLCLWDYESQLNKGDNIILTAFGGGFTWGAIYLKWAI